MDSRCLFVHRTAVVCGHFALADLGATAYQLAENAHGDLRRGYGADGRADRRMDFPERILRDAAVHERFVDECDFAARTDNAEIGVRQAEHLLLDRKITGMTVRHDNDIVFRGERYGLADWAKGRYATLPVKAGACIECGACESRCPYHLPIREMLKRAAESFGE